jgi:hypothetical protein
MLVRRFFDVGAIELSRVRAIATSPVGAISASLDGARVLRCRCDLRFARRCEGPSMSVRRFFVAGAIPLTFVGARGLTMFGARGYRVSVRSPLRSSVRSPLRSSVRRSFDVGATVLRCWCDRSTARPCDCDFACRCDSGFAGRCDSGFAGRCERASRAVATDTPARCFCDSADSLACYPGKQ